MIQYILECIAFQLVFLIIYDFFLKRETFFQWNRAYLIATYILSLVLPWIKIEAFQTAIPDKYYLYPEFLWGTNDAAILAAAKSTSFSISWEYEFLIGGMLLTTIFFGHKLMQLYRLRKKGQIHYFPDFIKIIVADSNLAFSFFRSIFLGDKVLETEHETIIQHELVHIKQRHSYDLIFFELMRIVEWFNPLVYVYQHRVSELHEFIADAQVAKTDKAEQYQLLLSQVFQTQKISFINQFVKSSLIKKRIVMLQKTKSKRISQLKYLLLVPVITSMLFYSSCQKEIGEGNTHTIMVSDIENLTEDEENRVFDRLKSLSTNSKDWELYVKDKNSTMKFIPSKDQSYISGPNNEKIKAKLAIDSKLKSGSDNYNFMGSSASGNPQSKYQELVMERQRLLKSTDTQNPIITNLDLQMAALKEQIIANNDGTVAFAWTEEAPIFPGCEGVADQHECFQKLLVKHISKHFNYPKEAQEKGVQGRVNIMFTISEDGSITNIRKRGPNKLLEDEAERIIKRLPKMTAGKYNGKSVNVPFSIPITFKLQ